MTEQVVKLFPFQMKILNSSRPIILSLVGRAAGKSFAASYFLLKKLTTVDGMGLLFSPTYKQSEIVLLYLQNICAQLGLEYCYNRAPGFARSSLPTHNNIFSVIINGNLKQLRVGSADIPDSLRSGSYSYAVCDEAAFIDEDSWNVFLPTLRGNGVDFFYQVLLVTSPNGMGWLYDKFIQTPSEQVEFIQAPSSENIYQVDQAKLDLWRETLSARAYSQEIEAQIISTNLSSIFYAFSKDAVQPQAAIGSKFLVGLDQNVSPGAGTIIQQRDTHFHILDEIYIDDGATYESYVREIIKRLPANCTIDLCGDASGNARNVAALQTFYTSVIAGLKQAGLTVYDKTLRSNPKVYQSREEINRLLERKLLHVDPRCKNLIRDFERAVWKQKGVFETDKALYDPHVCESMIYSIWQTRTSKVTATNSFFA